MNDVNPGKTFITTDGIQVNELEQDAVLSITTANNTYHVTVIDPETAQVRVRGGDYFRSDTVAQIAGSSLNSSVKPFGIYVGYSIEFFVHARRVRTSPVRVVRVLADSNRAASRSRHGPGPFPVFLPAFQRIVPFDSRIHTQYIRIHSAKERLGKMRRVHGTCCQGACHAYGS